MATWIKSLDYQTLLVIGFFLGFVSTSAIAGFIVTKKMIPIEEVSNKKFFHDGVVYDILPEGTCLVQKR